MAPTVFTIGYERRSPDELVRELTEAGLTLLVDLRELPLSRRRGFSGARSCTYAMPASPTAPASAVLDLPALDVRHL